MSRVEPALVELAAGRPLPDVDDGVALVRSAVEHRLAPLLAHQLRLGDRSLGSEAGRLLAFEELAGRSVSQKLAQARRTTLDRLAEAGFELALFKGEATAALWWPAAELRPSTDVDLFVNPDDVERLDGLVRTLDPDFPHADALPRLAAARTLQWLACTVADVAIDVHIDPMNLLARTRQLDRMWERAVSVRLADGASVRVLDPSTALVHWAVNQTRDGFPYLVGLADLRFALADPRIDWDEVARFAAAEGWTAMVTGALRYGCDMLGVTPPQPLGRQTPRERAIVGLLPLRSRLCGDQTTARARTTRWLVQLSAEGRSVDSLARFARRLFLPRSMLARHTDLSGPYLWRLYKHRMRSLRRG